MVAVGALHESTVAPTASPFALREKPLCIDLFCGLGGWAHGFLAEGYDVIGFDIERHQYGDDKYPGQLVLQDVLTLDGRQFRNAAVIVASPPCQFFSRIGMPFRVPWKQEEFERRKDLALSLFHSCFRIANEAMIPVVVENVCKAQAHVGRAAWHYGSYYLWGDVPALMPTGRPIKNAAQGGGSWFGISATNTVCGMNPDGRRIAHAAKQFDGVKIPGQSWSNFKKTGEVSPHWIKQNRHRDAMAATSGSKRKAASALAAKIPFPLAQHIARVFKPYPLARTEERAVQTEFVRSAKEA